MNQRAMNPCGMPERQRGFSLLEMLGALAIASALLIGLVSMMDNSLEDMKGQQAAAYQAQLTTAVRRYIAANHAALTASIPVGGNATAVTVNTLTTSGFLPAGFSDLNIYRQQGCALIRQPAAGQIDALVVTTGGTAIDDKDIAAVAANAGQGSGYIGTRAPGSGTVVGASWSLPTTAYRNVICAGGTALTGAAADAGHLVSRVFQNGDTRADFLYRNDVGVPELNTMNTPIRMANDAVVVAGDACPAAAIAVDADRELLQCGSDGRWTYVSKWKTPVANYAALNALGVKRHGDVRMAMDIKKAFVYDAPSNKWIALAENEDGDLIVTRHVTAGGTVTANELRSIQDTTVGRDLRVGNVGAQVGNVVIGGSVSVGDVSGLSGSPSAGDIRTGGSLLANRDVRAMQEMRSSWLIVDSSATAESLFINYNSDGHFNGWTCNITLFDRDGKPYKAWPVGTISAEGGNGWQYDAGGNPSIGYPNSGSGANTGKTLYCGADERWHYVNE